MLHKKKQVLASENGNECMIYTNKEYKDWYVKQKIKWVKTIIYL